MILLIDNYDSFVYNLSRYLVEMGCRTEVVRNDRVSVDDVRRLEPQAIILSPGPRTPREAGVSVELVQQLGPTVPILGVCLGHQAVCAALGATIVRAREPVHGRTSAVYHNAKNLFEALPVPLQATRYHSLVVLEETLPEELPVTARTVDGVPMAVEHRAWPLCGVQFHPESVLTRCGHRVLANFLKRARIPVTAFPSGELSALAGLVDDHIPADDQPWSAPHWIGKEPLHW